MDIEFFCPQCGRRTNKTQMQPFGKNKQCKGCGNVYKMSRETTRDATFGRIARTHPDWNVRAKALEELTDQNVLAEVLMGDREETVRAVALRLIDEPEPIVRAARQDPHKDVRKLAVSRIQEASVLAELIRFEPDIDVREAIVARIEDDGLLDEIAANTMEQLLVRCAAIGRMNDMERVQQLAQNPDPGIQAKAKQRLEELEEGSDLSWE